MGDLKHEISPALVRDLGRLMAAAWPAFPAGRLARAAGGLEPLELMARNAHVAAALGACMPADFAEAAAVMRRALASPELDGWIALPCVTWVPEAGIDDPATALPLLAALTPRFSAEWAVRPFLGAPPGGDVGPPATAGPATRTSTSGAWCRRARARACRGRRACASTPTAPPARWRCSSAWRTTPRRTCAARSAIT